MHPKLFGFASRQKRSQTKFTFLATMVILTTIWLTGVSGVLAQTATPTSSNFKASGDKDCPNIGPGDKWRVASKITQQANGTVLICLQIVAGDDDIDLSDTIVVELPEGAAAVQGLAEKGTVTTASSSVRWGSFSLKASESSSLLLTVATADLTSLSKTNVRISGRFTRGQAFQGLIPGLAPLTEVEVFTNGSFLISVPKAGFGPVKPAISQDLTKPLGVFTALILAGLLLLVGLRLARFYKKKS